MKDEGSGQRAVGRRRKSKDEGERMKGKGRDPENPRTNNEELSTHYQELSTKH